MQNPPTKFWKWSAEVLTNGMMMLPIRLIIYTVLCFGTYGFGMSVGLSKGAALVAAGLLGGIGGGVIVGAWTTITYIKFGKHNE